MKRKLWTLILVLLMGIRAIHAQDVDFSYVIQRDDQLVYVGEAEIILSQRIEGENPLGWNTNGRYFMTVIPDDSNNPDANVFILHELTSSETFSIPIDANSDLRYAMYFGDDQFLFTEWTYDAQIITLEDEQGLAVIGINVYEWAFEEGESSVRKIGEIPYGVGCGSGGLRSSIDIVYSGIVDGDTYGEYNRMVFVPTAQGIIHSNSCTKIRTLLTNPVTMESIELGDNLRWSVVSPDGEWIAGTQGNSLVLIHLDTLESTTISTADAPIYSLTWSDDSSHFYYVARSAGDQLPINDPQQTIYNPRPEDAVEWQSRIMRYDLATGESSEEYQASAYAIGNMSLINNSLIFKQIGDITAWVQAAIDAPSDLYNTDLIPVEFLQLNLRDGSITELPEGLAGVIIQPE